MMRRLRLILFLLLPIAASAQVSILKDINLNASTAGSTPNTFTAFNGAMFYVANDGITGSELWKSDGTPGNTTLVKDIYPGDASSAPYSFVVIGSTMYFVANDGEHGIELWKTDGTTAGTVLVSDIYPGTNNAMPYYLVNVNNTALYFSADDGVHGQEPWKLDVGTGAVSLILDINSNGANGSNPTEFTYVSGTTAYFGATDDATGTELWKTDGTTTTRIKDIAGGTNGSYPYNLHRLANNFVVFVADDGVTGPELYVSTNGSAAGTSLLKQINTNHTGSFPQGEFAQLGGFAYFNASSATSGSEVWRTDGTTAGTTQVSEISASTGSSSPANFTVFNGAVYFTATDGIGGTIGNELWKTTGGIPALVSNLNPGASSSPHYLTVFNNNLYFQATAANGTELYKCSTADALTLYDILPGPANSTPQYLAALGTTTLFFSANDGTGSELWKFDGATYSQVVDLVAGTSGGNPYGLLVYNSSTILFAADDGTGSDLWKTNGTPTGTVPFQAGGIINTVGTGSASISNMTLVGTNAYFAARDGSGDMELWRYDGTTVSKIDVLAGASSSSPNQLFALNSTTLLFTAYTPTFGYELYSIVNGSNTPALVKDIESGTGSSSPTAFMKTSGGYVYFRANSTLNGSELWRTDGTFAGTIMVPEAQVGSGSTFPQFMTELNGNIYFEGNSTATQGYELWRYNGTTTVLVKDINPTGGGFPTQLTVFNGDLYFRATSDGINYELFKMLGSTENVSLAKEINPGANSSNPGNFTVFNNRLYFQAVDGTHGTELWTVDPLAGITLFKDMNPGGASGGFSNAVISGTKMYFVGTGAAGVDVWVTDGTSCSTLAVPYAGETAAANSITPIGTKFVFSMLAQGTGAELFILDPAAITFPVPISINTQPVTQTVDIFSAVTFTVAATGSGLSYQWQKNGSNISGATSTSYNIASVADTDAGDYRVIVSGTCDPVTSAVATLVVTGSTPAAQPTGFTESNPTPTSFDVSFTASSPGSSGYLALRKKGSVPTETPVDGTVYTVGAILGSSVVAKASATTSFTDSGLDNASEYFYTIFSYNGSGSLIKYLTTSPLSGSGITLTAEPTQQPTSLVFSNIAASTLTGTFTAAAAGGTYLVIRKPDSNPTAVPADGIIYSAGATLGDAVVAYYGDALTFNDTGLNPTTKYYYEVFYARGVSATVNYNQVGPLQGNVTTLVAAPDEPTSFRFSNQTPNSFTVSFTPPSTAPAGYLVLRNQGTTLTAVPVDGTTYTLGQTVGDGKVAYVGVSPTFDESIPLLNYTYAVFAFNGSGTSINYQTITPLTGFIAPDDTPPVISNLTIVSVGSGAPVAIVASIIENESSVQEATVEYKSISSAAATTVKTMTIVDGKYQFPIPAGEIGALGVQYTIKATNTMGKISTVANKVAVTFTNQPFNTGSHGTDVTNYRIIAVPLILSAKTVNDVFADDLGPYDGVNWRMYRYEGASTSELTTTSLIEVGKGYWLIQKQDKAITTGAGITVPVTTDAPFTIDIVPGWNQIGNPYSFNILWSDILTASNVNLKLRTYLGQFQDGDRLRANEGGFVFANNNAKLIFPTVYNGSAGRVAGESERITNSIDQPDWEVMLHLKHGDVTNIFGGVGMNREANIDYDKFDDFTLPRFLDYVELNHDKKLLNNAYTKNVVPTAANFTWEFTIESESDGITEINWDNSYFGSNEKQIVLWDEHESMPIDMRRVSSYSFNQSGARRFHVIYGSDDYVSEKSMSDKVRIHSVSPNPTDNDLTVTFSIPSDQSMTEVKVLNVLGQPVAMMYQGPLAGGTYTMTWSGRDQSGVRPSPGVYLVEVNANGQKQAKRIVLK